jgi:hypothetical protein
MNKINILTAICLSLLFLNSCGSVVEGISSGKKKNSDEFLIEKKAPLILPPSYGELPEPGEKTEDGSISSEENISSIEKIISQDTSQDATIGSERSNSSIEKSIIEKVKE